MNPSKARPSKPVEEPKGHEKHPTVAVAQIDEKLEQEHKANNLPNLMYDLGMYLENPDTSTMMVHLPERGGVRLLTVVFNSTTHQTVLQDTPIPHTQPSTIASPSRSQEAPFLKVGRHGRGGDFENDLDRETGRGHDISPRVYREFEGYRKFRGQVLRRYPRYPQVSDGETVSPEVKQAWNENEMWYINFKKTYRGYFVAHLWPCGCEVPRNGDESEEE
jgi:hypothetical protein